MRFRSRTADKLASPLGVKGIHRIGAHEASTHLTRLLDAVGRGQTITITKRGVPVAELAPPSSRTSMTVRGAIAGLREFRRAHCLERLTVRELIDEGRR